MLRSQKSRDADLQKSEGPGAGLENQDGIVDESTTPPGDRTDLPPSMPPEDNQAVWDETSAFYPILQGIGRVFITVGLLVLSFLGYQLWGTNAVTNKTQQALAAEFEKPQPIPPGSANSPRVAPETGTGMAKIIIPKIGVNQVVVEGVDDETLKKGPGHYPDTAMPGEAGNFVISGHRTTYGAPFYRLDELKPGDEITIEDAAGTYKYKVTEKKIVLPSDLSVVVPSTDARLTLTTCHPRFSARQRLIIVAALEGTPR